MEAAGYTVVKQLNVRENTFLVTRTPSDGVAGAALKAYEKQFVVRKYDVRSLSSVQLKEVIAEVSRLQQASHPNVLSIVDCFVENYGVNADTTKGNDPPERCGAPALCLVTEQGNGVSLSKEIQRRATQQDRTGRLYMSELQVMFIFTQVVLAQRHFEAKGFTQLHDCNPNSILLTKTYLVKLCIASFVKMKIDSFGTRSVVSRSSEHSSVWKLGTLLYELCILEKYPSDPTAAKSTECLDSPPLAHLIDSLIHSDQRLRVDNLLWLPYVAGCFDQLIASLPVTNYPELNHLHTAYAKLKGGAPTLLAAAQAAEASVLATSQQDAPSSGQRFIPKETSSSELNGSPTKRRESECLTDDSAGELVKCGNGPNVVTCSPSSSPTTTVLSTKVSGTTVEAEHEYFINPEELQKLSLTEMEAVDALCEALEYSYELPHAPPGSMLPPSSLTLSTSTACEENGFRYLSVGVEQSLPSLDLKDLFVSKWGTRRLREQTKCTAEGSTRSIKAESKDTKPASFTLPPINIAKLGQRATGHVNNSSRSHKSSSSTGRSVKTLAGVSDEYSTPRPGSRAQPNLTLSPRSHTATAKPPGGTKPSKPKAEGPTLKEVIARRRLEAAKLQSDDTKPLGFVPVLTDDQLMFYSDRPAAAHGNKTLLRQPSTSRGRRIDPKPVQSVVLMHRGERSNVSFPVRCREEHVIVSDDDLAPRLTTTANRMKQIRKTVAGCEVAEPINIDDDDDDVEHVVPIGVKQPSRERTNQRSATNCPTNTKWFVHSEAQLESRQAEASSTRTLKSLSGPSSILVGDECHGVRQGVGEEETTRRNLSTLSESTNSTRPVVTDGVDSCMTERSLGIGSALLGEDADNGHNRQEERLTALKDRYRQFANQRVSNQREKCIQIIGNLEMFEWIYRLLNESRRSSPSALRQQVAFCESELQLSEACLSEVLSLIDYEAGLA